MKPQWEKEFDERFPIIFFNKPFWVRDFTKISKPIKEFIRQLIAKEKKYEIPR